MNRQVRQLRQSKRVADYFLVVGCLDTGENILETLPEAEQFLPSPIVKSKRIIGSNNENNSNKNENNEIIKLILSKRFSADILDRYPSVNYKDFPFPEVCIIFFHYNSMIFIDNSK